MSIFQEDGVLNTRKIVSVEMRYHNRKDDKDISIGLYHSVESDYKNRISVSGLDEKWVNGTFSGLQDTLKNCERQKTFFANHFILIALVFWACFAFSVFMIFGFLTELSVKYIKSSSAVQSAKTIFIGVRIGLGIVFGTELTKALTKDIGALYPDVELLVGPEHLQREARKRRRLLSILAIVIIPTLIGIVLALVF
jgi:hypothetical protein